MEVNLNPSMTVRPEPISAAKPHQFLPPTENGKYPSFAEIYRAKQLQILQLETQGQAPPVEQIAKQTQPPENFTNNSYELLVRTNENISFQRDSYSLARILNNRINNDLPAR